MTPTTKEVQRVTETTKVFSAGEHRKIIVRIARGDILMFRELGARRWYSLPIGNAYIIAVNNTTRAKLRTINDERKALGQKALSRIPLKLWNKT